MKLRIGRRAQQQAARIAAWWGERRPSAPQLFLDELEATFRLLCDSPGVGSAWPTERRPDLRRVLMPRTGDHVYFRVDETTRTVHVLAVWGTPRGRGPTL